MTPKFLAYLVILCFERRYPRQNIVTRLKSNVWQPKPFFAPLKILGLLSHWFKERHSIPTRFPKLNWVDNRDSQHQLTRKSANVANCGIHLLSVRSLSWHVKANLISFVQVPLFRSNKETVFALLNAITPTNKLRSAYN